MNPIVIDSHAHLDMPEFDPDREEVIQRAADSGVTRIITIGINPESNQKAIRIADTHPGIWAALGIHPQESKGITLSDIEQMIEMSRHPRVVAIGELGLDYFHDYAPHEVQQNVLQWQLETVKKTALPIIIHCRKAQADMLKILQEWCSDYPLPEGKPRGVWHCFQEDEKMAETYIQMGFYISLGAYIGYPSSSRLRETLKNLPMDRIVVETDCPFLPPQKLRGKRNEPAYTLSTLGVLAEAKGLTLEEAAEQTTQNALKVFNLR